MAKDAPRSIASVIYASVVGPCSFILQPGLVQGMVELRGYTEEQAGIVASAENAGLALGTILVALTIHTISWTVAVRRLVILAALANFASALVGDHLPFGVLRFVSAVGSGGLIALAFSMMGLTLKDQRNFSLTIVAVLAYGGLGLLVLPSAFATVGFNGVLVFFGLFCLSVLALLRDLAHYQDDDPGEGGEAVYKFTPPMRLITLGGMLLYNIAIGMVWVYLFLVGVQAGMGEQEVANALTISQFLGVAGALLASVLQYRFGRNLPIFLGVWGGAYGVFLLTGVIDATAYWLGVCAFNLLWNLTVPYMLAILARFDDAGRFVSQGVAIQFLGYAVGPYIASQLVSQGAAQPFDPVNLAAVVLFVASALLLLPINLSKDGGATGGARAPA